MMKVIALEEHFATPEAVEAWKTADPGRSDPALHASTEGDSAHRLLDFGNLCHGQRWN